MALEKAWEKAGLSRLALMMRAPFVRGTNARIEHGHDNVAGGTENVPGLGRVDGGVRGAAALSGVVQSPERSVQILRIVRRGRRMHLVVRFGKLDEAAALIAHHQS